MERSIENIWKNGFEAEIRLSAPRISNLYKRKSGQIIRKINSTSKKDDFNLIPVGVIIFGIFVFMRESPFAYIWLYLFPVCFFKQKDA